MPEDKSDDTHVGARVESDGHYGTLKYIGKVSGTNGEWLGIEWDDPSRGKHDGSHNGERYFKTSQETAGSFIRRAKANFGISFSEAFQERYSLVEDESAGINQDEMFINNQKIEFVGAQKLNQTQSQFALLREVGIRGTFTNGETVEKDFSRYLPNVCTLDLSVNLFASWKAVSEITRHMTHLKFLNVGSNKLELPADPDSYAKYFANVQELYITRLGYDWEQVLACCHMFPQIQELHLCFNHITTITRFHPLLSNLTILNLEGNDLSGWADVLKMGCLERLRTLLVNSTGIDEIYFNDVQHPSKTACFPSLQYLYCQKNKLYQWSSIDELNKLQNLKNLYFKDNPLTEEENNPMPPAYIRSHIIARIAGLKILNRTEVSRVERKGSELDYLKAYGKAWKAAGGHEDPARNRPTEEFTTTYPRYLLLVGKYGALEEHELVYIATTALKSKLVSLSFSSISEPDKPVAVKKIPLTMSILKLKALTQKLFQLPPVNQKLSYISQEMPGCIIPMELDTKEIGFYAIETGDTVVVEWE